MSKLYKNEAEALKLAKKYGIERGRILKMDNANYQKEYQKWKSFDKRLAAAAQNDYDTRRTMEAAAMAGNEQAKQFAQKGFSDRESVVEANKLMEQWHKDNGNTGDFSSAADFAGLTYNKVQQDRQVLNQSVDQRVENLRNEFIDKLSEQPAAEPEEITELDESDRLKQARAFTKDKESNPFAGDKDSAFFQPSTDPVGSQQKAQDLLAKTKQSLNAQLVPNTQN